MTSIIGLIFRKNLPLKKLCNMKRLLLQLLAVLLSGVMHAQIQIKPTQPKQQLKTHHVGEKWGGGIVILVDPHGHGLIVESLDLNGSNWSWDTAREIMKLNCVHSTDGAKFSDWRLPTKDELNRIYLQKNIIGGFSSDSYWSSSCSFEESIAHVAWYQNFVNGNQDTGNKPIPFRVRAVRAF